MNHVPLNVIKKDKKTVTPYIKTFANDRVISMEQTDNGTLIEYENPNQFTSNKYTKNYEVSEDFYLVQKRMSEKDDPKLELLEKVMVEVLKQNNAYIEQENRIKIQADALSGDYSLSIVPDTKDLAATGAAWEQEITITLSNAIGVIHSWKSGQLSVSIAHNSSAGIATIVSTTPDVVNGVARVLITGANAWVAGDDITLTVDDLTLQGKTVTGGTAVITII